MHTKSRVIYCIYHSAKPDDVPSPEFLFHYLITLLRTVNSSTHYPSALVIDSPYHLSFTLLLPMYPQNAITTIVHQFKHTYTHHRLVRIFPHWMKRIYPQATEARERETERVSWKLLYIQMHDIACETAVRGVRSA